MAETVKPAIKPLYCRDVSIAELRGRYNGCKPCLHGSDAHAQATVGLPVADRFSWVKGAVNNRRKGPSCTCDLDLRNHLRRKGRLRRLRSNVGPACRIDARGTGTITYGTDTSDPYNATLSAVGSSMYRLDVTSQKGTSSIRIDGKLGKTQLEDGRILIMPLETALGGLFPFELARTFIPANHAVSLKDGGLSTLAGHSLHRITLERTTLGTDPSSHLPNTIAIDLYFDPATNLLVQTAAMLPVTGSRNLKLLSVVTYSDYRKVGTSFVPFRFSETIQGEPYLTLQLATVQLAPALDANFFTF